MSALHDLNLHLLDWDKQLREQETVNMAAATAEAKYRALKAKALTTAKFKDPKISLGLAEALADADDAVAEALTERLVTAAKADSVRSRLQWFRAKADAGRSEVANDRAASQLYASHGRDA